MQAPVVETERLRLRPWQKADFRPYHAILQHPEVHRHFGPEPMGQEECWRRLLASVGCWQVNGFGTYYPFYASNVLAATQPYLRIEITRGTCPS